MKPTSEKIINNPAASLTTISDQKEITVKGVIFFPNDSPINDYFKYKEQDKEDLMRILKTIQERYKIMLNGATFTLEPDIEIYRSPNPHKYFIDEGEGKPDRFHKIIYELLKEDNSTRCNSKFVYVIVYWRPNDYGYTAAGGRTFNGGPGTGSGGVYIDIWDFKSAPNILSTSEHELGHAFGLLHCSNHGETMEGGNSVMCYTEEHKSTGRFTLSKTPGILTEEDKYLLNLNKKVFPKFEFSPTRKLINAHDVDGRPLFLYPMDEPLLTGKKAIKYYDICNS